MINLLLIFAKFVSEGMLKVDQCLTQLWQQVRMHYRSGTGGTLLHRWWADASFHSPGGSTFLRKMRSWPPSWNYDVKSSIWLRQSMHNCKRDVHSSQMSSQSDLKRRSLRAMIHAQKTCIRNLYQRLSPNRTQLLYQKHSHPINKYNFGHKHRCKFLVQVSCTSFFSVCHSY